MARCENQDKTIKSIWVLSGNLKFMNGSCVTFKSQPVSGLDIIVEAIDSPGFVEFKTRYDVEQGCKNSRRRHKTDTAGSKKALQVRANAASESSSVKFSP